MSDMSIKGLFSKLLPGGRVANLEEKLDAVAVRQDLLAEWLEEATGRMGAMERQTEATRKKVYRDDEQTEAEKLIALAAPQPAFNLGMLRAGEPIPPQFMNNFGG